MDVTRGPYPRVEDNDNIQLLVVPKINYDRDREPDSSKNDEQHKIMAKKCKPPNSKKFGHPCNCGSSYAHSYLKQQQQLFQQSAQNANGSDLLPPIAYGSPMYLYDPTVKRCLPTSRSRDMLLKDCHPTGLQMANFQIRSQPPLPQTTIASPCYYSDLTCDQRKYRCVCKQPNLHLFYSSDTNPTSFGCVPLNITTSNANQCRQGQFYNVITKECQKVFDSSELPSSMAANTHTATQMSFATIVLIWILLLIVILVAKLRKLKRHALYGSNATNSTFERRRHNQYHYQPSAALGQGDVSRHRGRATTAWLHPFMAAVNGHHYLSDRNQDHFYEHSQNRDTDLFLAQNRHLNGLIPGPNLSGSEQSINTMAPPKFEEIYPSCPEENGLVDPNTTLSPRTEPPPHPPPNQPPPATNDELPTYEEAMKMEDTRPEDAKPQSTETDTDNMTETSQK